MKLRLRVIIAAFIAMVVYIPVAHGQANLTFSGGGGTPLSTTLQNSIIYTTTSNCGNNPNFVFQGAGNSLIDSNLSVTGNINVSINGGAAKPITNEVLGSNAGIDISANDIYLYGNLAAGSINGTVVLSAGTITSSGNATAAPTNGSYITFLANGATRCSTNGVAAVTTAATVSVSGHVRTQLGRGVAAVRLSLTDSSGQVRTTTTTENGYYQFTDVEVGSTYIITATGKRFTFSQPSQVLNVNDETTEINFIANSEKRVRVF